MKILYLAHRIPYPPNKGDKIRSYNQIAYLSDNNELDLICLADDPADLKYLDALKEICRHVHVRRQSTFWSKLKGVCGLLLGAPVSQKYFYREDVQAVFDQWLDEQRYDAIICFSSPMAEYVFKSNSLILKSQENRACRPRLIMDFCDVDSDKWQQYALDASLLLKSLYNLESRRLRAYEGRIATHFDHSLLISDKEANLFLQNHPTAVSKVEIIRNGVDESYFSPDYVKSWNDKYEKDIPVLVFTGAMNYHANVDGVQWFCLKVLPKIQAKLPGLKFYIVGSNPSPVVQGLGRLPGVVVTGYVDDIRDYYHIADVCVAPLRLARGVQNKVLEAMAMGKPIVTSTKANDGIQAQDGEHLFLADNTDAFSRVVVKLLKDRELRGHIGQNARSFVVDRFNWKTNMSTMTTLISTTRLTADNPSLKKQVKTVVECPPQGSSVIREAT